MIKTYLHIINISFGFLMFKEQLNILIYLKLIFSNFINLIDNQNIALFHPKPKITLMFTDQNQ